MLSIKPIGSSSGQVNYYVSLGHEDYYTRGGEPLGVWWGAGAAELGLSGQVAREAFQQLLLGYSPDGKTKLVQNAGNSERRAAFDLTFSVPKSVSVAWSQGELTHRRLIETVCEVALAKTLNVFAERCGITRRGHLGARLETAKLIAAIFRHETARGLPDEIPDANLHWHVVLLNAVIRADHSTGAFDARKLFAKDVKMMLGAMFRAELSKELEHLGLASHRPERENGRGPVSWFELNVVPREFVRAMSKRRQAIEKWLLKNNASGAKISERAALATRRKKEHYPRAELFSSWKKLGQDYGFSTNELSRALAADLNPGDVEAETKAAVERALKIITDQRARFSEVELLRFTAEEAQTRGIGILDVRQGVEQTLKHSPEIVRLQETQGEKNFTTREILAIERRLFDSAKNAQGNSAHTVSSCAVANVLRSFDHLSAEQIGAVRHITTLDSRVTCINGMAGTGKTTLLGAARKIWEQAGMQVIGTALAATAAKRLEEGSEIPSIHIHKLLTDIKTGQQHLTPSMVLVVDEASMISTRQMEALTSRAESAGTKIVLIGDIRQLAAIEAGAPFRGIAERIGCYELQEIIRQRKRWMRKSVHELAAGNADLALARYAKRGLLHIGADRDEAIKKLVEDWAKSALKYVRENLIFVGTHLERVTINRLCQRERLKAGQLSEASLTVGSNEFHVGDRVLFTKNKALLFLRNGEMGTVTAISPSEDQLRIQLDDGLSVTVDTTTYDQMELGYASTTHAAQGKSVERAFVLVGGPMTDREISYVQGSRAKGMTYFYTDVLSGGESIEELARQMSRSRPKELAHDFLESF